MALLATIVAYFFIGAAACFFFALAALAAVALQYWGQFKRVKAMAMRPKDAGMHVYLTGRGIANREAVRLRAIAGSARGAVDKIKSVRAEIADAAQTIDVDETRAAAQEARESVANAFSAALLVARLARQLLEIARDARGAGGANGYRAASPE